MRAFHDSRDVAYRAPYGAVAPWTPVEICIDVWDAPDAAVTLRTWADGEGETLYEMEAAPAPAADGAVRYTSSIAPAESGIVWYSFIICDAAGNTVRYGACEGSLGGVGRLWDWEPPSFPLAAYGPEDASSLLAGIFAGTDPIRQAPMAQIVKYLRNEATALEVAEGIEVLRETCPPEVLRGVCSLLGSYGQHELFGLLAGVPNTPEALAANYHDDPSKAGLAKGRLWCACLVQMLASAVPVVGDPAARPDASEEPACVDADCENIVANALELHDTLPVFTQGSLQCFALNEDVFGFWRRGADGTAACVLLNASLQHAYDVAVPLAGEAVSDILGGQAVPVVSADEAPECRIDDAAADKFAVAHLYQLGSAILYFHPRERLGRPMEPGFGVLAHITSLATPDGTPGTFGMPARAFVDWLAQAGVRYWQVLPVNPTDEHGSPYAGISAFAGNVSLIEGGAAAIDEAFIENYDEYQAFCEREADWLEPYACFMAIRAQQGAGVPWQEWPEAYRHFDPRILEQDKELRNVADQWRRAQFTFDRQWRELRAYANERGVQIVGDMPIYVSADSADVWANPQIFQLAADGAPEVVAGCPPDGFAAEGQVWGNPVYDWDACQRSGYAWWLRRLQRAFDLYDVVRLDHFIGFCRYFCIPAGEKALKGAYRPGPGLDFFHAARDAFGQLPIIAEDLGSITPGVRALGSACGFPGMDIIQFVDGNDPLRGYQPRPEKIAYTGTHDNQTLRGYVATRYPDLDEEEAACQLARAVACCNAPVCVMPLQDVLNLDDTARMNTPGTCEGNWAWRADAADVAGAFERLQELVKLHEEAKTEE